MTTIDFPRRQFSWGRRGGCRDASKENAKQIDVLARNKPCVSADNHRMANPTISNPVFRSVTGGQTSQGSAAKNVSVKIDRDLLATQEAHPMSKLSVVAHGFNANESRWEDVSLPQVHVETGVDATGGLDVVSSFHGSVPSSWSEFTVVARPTDSNEQWPTGPGQNFRFTPAGSSQPAENWN